MRFSKAIKRIIALGAGATMLGATLGGAMAAADLSNYPSPFIKDGKFSGVLVIGDKAAAEDVIGVSDIAVSLQFAATKAAGTTTTEATVEGDAWKVGSSTKILELSEELTTPASATGTYAVYRETMANITTYIGSGDLKALADGEVANTKVTAPYKQYLYMLGPQSGFTSGYVVYAEDEKDVTADFLYFKSGDQIARYVLEFTTALESDVDDSAGTQTSTGTYLTDFEDADLIMFGKTYTIVQARRTSSTGNNIKLILMGGAVKDTLLEGETKTYTIGGKDFETTLDFVDADEAKFTINGEATRKLKDGDTDKLSDGTEVGVSEVLYQDYAGGIHSATFYLGAQKLELKDTLMTDGVGYSNNLKVGDNTIDDAFVSIEGTDDNSTFKLNRISVNMTCDDNFYVPAGAKLSENSELTEPEVLFTNQWDIEYHGLKSVETEAIAVDTSGSSKYVLEFVDGGGNKVTVPIAKTPSGSNLLFGDTDKDFINRENWSINKNDYLVITDTTQKRGERKTYILQYKGADKITADSPVIKFKNLGDDSTIEVSYTASTSGGDIQQLGTLKLGGADHRIYNQSSIASNDFGIYVDLDGSGALATGEAYINQTVNITTYYGAEIGITNTSAMGSAGTTEGIIVTVKTPDESRDGSSKDSVQTVYAVDFGINITASSGKVQHSKLSTHTSGMKGTSLALRTPEGEDNVEYGYTAYGAFITRKTPTNEPATVKIDYPKDQREALVYITAKGATITSAAAATGEAVTINRIEVGATKLASEVADIKAVNAILVGGPCANAGAAELMGNPEDCGEGFEAGKGLIQLFENDGNVAMLVAGAGAADTRAAAKVVANYGDYALKGTKMEVTTATSKVTEVTETAATTEETTA